MNKAVLSGIFAGCLAVGAAAPAHACMSMAQQRVVHPVMEVAPDVAERNGQAVFRIAYSGKRSGREDLLWPNFYVVGVIEGDWKGRELAIPAHVTSCHSVQIEIGENGYVMGRLITKGKDGEPLETPVLEIGLNGRVTRFEFG